MFPPGKLDPTNHTVTGDSIAYIYPDMETSFLGKFENKLMRRAQEASVQVRLTQQQLYDCKNHLEA